MEERLDRVLSTNSWRIKFDKANVAHLPNESSDHMMLLLDTKHNNINHKKIFIFCQRWLSHKGVKGVVEKTWGTNIQGSRIFKIGQKIKHCSVAMLRSGQKKLKTKS
ncbi:hypothetical protein ACH5RR_036842 [Cinchona calisaya]|uniref:Uncharacterized protein n=1 Tax=Cinchona calisaya TaxID=153742 RepID=A0ABD2Y4F5_9GENT